MRYFLLICAVVACGSALAAPKPARTFTNTLGMKFVPVSGTEVAFCIWETRVKDYATYAAANAGVGGSWSLLRESYPTILIQRSSENPHLKRQGFKQPDTHPAQHVSWNDAQAFCAWLTKKELAAGKIKAGQKYRLPTYAEWSVAVGLGKEKGITRFRPDEGVKDVYPWGKEWPPPVGAGNYGGWLNVDKFDYTSPVGSFAANKHGLHDMGGNVQEWCEDKWGLNGSYRVMRGASWYFFSPDFLRSDYRDVSGLPDSRAFYIGFRCVLVGTK